MKTNHPGPCVATDSLTGLGRYEKGAVVVTDLKPEPAEKTPKGFSLPVPKRKDFYSDLEKMVKAPQLAKRRPPTA